jgi:hypothetical protein
MNSKATQARVGSRPREPGSRQGSLQVRGVEHFPDFPSNGLGRDGFLKKRDARVEYTVVNDRIIGIARHMNHLGETPNVFVVLDEQNRFRASELAIRRRRLDREFDAYCMIGPREVDLQRASAEIAAPKPRRLRNRRDSPRACPSTVQRQSVAMRSPEQGRRHHRNTHHGRNVQ